jgi:hypothetical protein
MTGNTVTGLGVTGLGMFLVLLLPLYSWYFMYCMLLHSLVNFKPTNNHSKV